MQCLRTIEQLIPALEARIRGARTAEVLGGIGGGLEATETGLRVQVARRWGGAGDHPTTLKHPCQSSSKRLRSAPPQQRRLRINSLCR